MRGREPETGPRGYPVVDAGDRVGPLRRQARRRLLVRGPAANSTSTSCASAASDSCFPDISTLAHLEHTVRLVASGRVRLKPTITHVLHGLEAVPQAFEITANKGKYQAINPAQVVLCQ